MPKKKKAKVRAKKAVSKAKKVKGPKKAARAGKKVSAKSKAKAKGLPSGVEKLAKVGEVTHYFPHVKAAAILILKDSIKVGDKIYIKGHTTDFKEKIVSIQLEHQPIEEGTKGQEIGLLVKNRVRIGDSVYKL